MPQADSIRKLAFTTRSYSVESVSGVSQLATYAPTVLCRSRAVSPGKGRPAKSSFNNTRVPDAGTP